MNKIKIIGISVCLYGLWELFRQSPLLIYGLKNLSGTIQSSGIFLTILMIAYPLLLLWLVIGGIFFILLKNWGRIIILSFLVIDICFRLFGICNYWHACFTMNKPITIPEGALVVKFSMIPGYIILAVEILVLYLITSKNITEKFK
ncbi:MAG: hypothetical protein COV72_09075 [Candidatus Omnitrophica bacterium CG11_big_fil_rev_8_21_14_0_20_42_13]|uniref:Uncharacterized protein n=1 Tax=Candidatus Ghiorseimicrobium undicola TaxID=1974746 RepID=A0A2H0LV70_9BACT|nr:MAG: hypothetical protein COV72_09075 [Candidatus Omnitrophica bacterium CG11_big_fil_rev_8_21_14_0_20_42_13]